MLECKSYNKLIRDNTVDVLKNSENVHRVIVTSAMNDGELNDLITAKLVECANKLRENYTNTGKLNITDIVNVQEILDKIKHEAPYDQADFKIEQEKVASHNGKFDLNMVLKYMEKAI